MRKPVKYSAYAIFAAIVFLLVVEFGLLFLGLSGIAFRPTATAGDVIAVTMDVPNKGFIPIQGAIVTQVFDATTGQQVGYGNDPVNLPPGAVTPVTIDVHLTQATSDAIRVKMGYEFSVLGMADVTIPMADVTLPPLGV